MPCPYKVPRELDCLSHAIFRQFSLSTLTENPPDHLGGAGGYVTEGSSGIQHFELSDWRPGVCRSNQIDRRRHVSFAAPLSPTGHLLSATWPQNRYTPRLTLTLNFQKHRAGISYSTAQIVLRMTKLSS